MRVQQALESRDIASCYLFGNLADRQRAVAVSQLSVHSLVEAAVGDAVGKFVLVEILVGEAALTVLDGLVFNVFLVDHLRGFERHVSLMFGFSHPITFEIPVWDLLRRVNEQLVNDEFLVSVSDLHRSFDDVLVRVLQRKLPEVHQTFPV